ncbi:hypothetical protein DSC45_24570 [Streptomyces sp. YIM 130001]|uniref:DUF5994 family protein n=1 Tax=Streptomyces sp. YIM 130001 TaxID=2259644 RepID=UPI000E64A362|nr:DUF5994 family protein [Streptomyces sp. YIM 130001]RII13028.1 hypothetical protein DSC45_24570 [Streptomyces sp. YIM 130001]
MTVITARTPPVTPASEPPGHPPLRLSLKPPGPRTGLLDGAWWPRSRDLERELPALADMLDPLWGRITRLTVNPTHWPHVPRKIPVNGHVVKVGWFRGEQDPHQLLLFSYHVGRWDLLIIPPETAPEAAERLMVAACTPRMARTGSALIADEREHHPTAPAAVVPPGGSQAAAWEAEGGAMAPPSGARVGR